MSEPQKQENLNIDVTIHKPFGPRVLTAKVPMEWVDALNEQCEETMKKDDKQKHDASDYLVGHVHEELSCDLNYENLTPFGNFISNATSALFNEFNKEQKVLEAPRVKEVNINTAWFVRSYKGDYNPTHIHTNCAMSLVLYLKVPDSIGDTNYKNTKEVYTTEGYIDFINGMPDLLVSSKWTNKPQVGDLYLFPSNLMHTVYPFYGEGERRTFSCNLDLKFHEKGPILVKENG